MTEQKSKKINTVKMTDSEKEDALEDARNVMYNKLLDNLAGILKTDADARIATIHAEIAKIHAEKQKILDWFKLSARYMIDDINKIYNKITMSMADHIFTGDIPIYAFDKKEHMQIFKNQLKEYFPNSELTYSEHYLHFRVDENDIILNQARIDKCKAYLKRREKYVRQIEEIRRKMNNLSFSDDENEEL
jgi:hypothetical protein